MSQLRIEHFRSGWAIGLAAFLWAVVGQAQPTSHDKAAAEALFDQGLQHLEARRLQEACASFERSQSIDPAVGTLLYLAECYERTQRSASAWGTFREAASLARQWGDGERAKIAEDRAARLEPSLSRVALIVGDNVNLPNFQLRRNGESMSPALFGVAIPLDPGAQELSASADGYQTWSGSFEVVAGSAPTSLIIPQLQPELAAPPESPPREVVPAAELPPAQTTTPPAELDEGLVMPSPQTWILTGVGVVGIGVGAVLGIKAAADDADSDEFCDNDLCFDRRGESLSRDARRAALAANVSYAVGGAALLTGVLWYITQDSADSDQASAFRPQVGWSPDIGNVTLGVHKTF